MNIDQEWNIMVNIALRRIKSGIEDVSDRAIVEVNEILGELNTSGKSLNQLAKAMKEAKDSIAEP